MAEAEKDARDEAEGLTTKRSKCEVEQHAIEVASWVLFENFGDGGTVEAESAEAPAVFHEDGSTKTFGNRAQVGDRHQAMVVENALAEDLRRCLAEIQITGFSFEQRDAALKVVVPFIAFAEDTEVVPHRDHVGDVVVEPQAVSLQQHRRESEEAPTVVAKSKP